MENPQQRPKSSGAGRRIAKVAFAVPIALAIIFIVKGLPRDRYEPDSPAAPAPRNREANDPGAAGFVARFEQTPQFRYLLAPVKAAHRSEYQEFLSRLLASPQRDDQVAVNRLTLAFTRELARSRIDLITSAPAPDLRRVAQAYAALGRALRNGGSAPCAAFARFGAPPPDALGPAQLPHVGAVTQAQLAAARAAQAAPGRPRTTFRQEDAAAFYTRIRADHPAAAGLLGDDAALERAGPRGQCEVGAATWAAAAALPDDEQSAHVTAVLLRTAVASR